MKRNEFKLLIENWRKNFIVESGIPKTSDEEIKQDYFDYFNDGSLEEPGLDDLDHPSHMHSPDYDSLDLEDLENPTYSSDSEEDIDGFSGMYPDDPTYTPGDYSSIGGDDIDDLLPQIDENYDQDDNDGF